MISVVRRGGCSMATYLVGADDKTLFKRRTTWDFEEALNQAQDGDVIELQRNFSPICEEDVIEIGKSIKIQGHTEKNGENLFTSNLPRIRVMDGAVVTLEKVEIAKNREKVNLLSVSGGSTLKAKDVRLKNSISKGKLFPIIYIDEQSKAYFDDVNVIKSSLEDQAHEIIVGNSEFSIESSTFEAVINLEKTQFFCNNSTVINDKSNTLFVHDNSTCIINNSFFSGGKILKDTTYPCIKAIDSKLTFNHVQIYQPKYNRALLTENSKVSITEGSVIDSATFKKSKVKMEDQILISESLAFESSNLDAVRVFIKGEENNKINFFADGTSVINADTIAFGILTDPNIRVERTVKFKVPNLNQLQYDQNEKDFVLDEENCFSIIGEVNKIDLFGDLTASQRLDAMTGLAGVKREVKEFIAMSEMNKRRKDSGLSSSGLNLHSLFLGNPGTGKTTVARLLGELLYQKGIIASKNFKEVDRSDLVAQYVGQTATKTKKVLESALGGVLFIDEAYTLAKSDGNDFGAEAIDEILKFMEDHRSDIVLIFAGYTDSMEKFLQMNEGLKSRIPNVFSFEDYTTDELIKIGLDELHKQKYVVDEKAYSELLLNNFSKSDDKSNGRWVRNLNERLTRKMALRLSADPQAKLTVITREDLEKTKI